MVRIVRRRHPLEGRSFELRGWMRRRGRLELILVLADGEIMEQGTHQQLVALGGRYAELFELQAAGYR